MESESLVAVVLLLAVTSKVTSQYQPYPPYPAYPVYSTYPTYAVADTALNNPTQVNNKPTVTAEKTMSTSQQQSTYNAYPTYPPYPDYPQYNSATTVPLDYNKVASENAEEPAIVNNSDTTKETTSKSQSPHPLEIINKSDLEDKIYKSEQDTSQTQSPYNAYPPYPPYPTYPQYSTNTAVVTSNSNPPGKAESVSSVNIPVAVKSLSTMPASVATSQNLPQPSNPVHVQTGEQSPHYPAFTQFPPFPPFPPFPSYT